MLKIILLSITPVLVLSCNKQPLLPYMEGSGTINSYELNTSVSHIKVNGSGSGFISVEDRLEARNI